MHTPSRTTRHTRARAHTHHLGDTHAYTGFSLVGFSVAHAHIHAFRRGRFGESMSRQCRPPPIPPPFLRVQLRPLGEGKTRGSGAVWGEHEPAVPPSPHSAPLLRVQLRHLGEGKTGGSRHLHSAGHATGRAACRAACDRPCGVRHWHVEGEGEGREGGLAHMGRQDVCKGQSSRRARGSRGSIRLPHREFISEDIFV